MTSPTLPSLLGFVPPQATPASEGAASSNAGAGPVATDFSVMLAAMLPAVESEPAAGGTSTGGTGTGGKAESQKKPQQYDLSGEQEPRDPSKDQEQNALLVTLAVPVAIIAEPAIVSIAAPAGGAPESGTGTLSGNGGAEPNPTNGLGEQQPALKAGEAGSDLKPAEAPAAPPAPAPFAIPPGFLSGPAEPTGATQPQSGQAGTSDVAAAAVDAAKRSPGAWDVRAADHQAPRSGQLAFAARLTSPTVPAPAPAAGQRVPELHLAMPPEMRNMDTEAGGASQAPRAAQAPAATPGVESARALLPAAAPQSSAGTPITITGPSSDESQSPRVPASGQATRPAAATGAVATGDAAAGLAGGTQAAPPAGQSARPAAARQPDATPPVQQAAAAPGQHQDAASPGKEAPEHSAASFEEPHRAASQSVKPRTGSASAPPAGESGGQPGGPAQQPITSGAAPVAHGAAAAAAAGLERADARGGAAEVSHVPQAAEVQAARPEAAKAPAVREFSVVVPGRTSENGTTSPQVEVRVAERAGEVQVAVRTTDSRLTSSLRQDLPQLVSQLSDRGYRAETWHPGAAPGAGDGGAVRAGNDSSDARGDGDASGNSGRGGSDSAGRDGNHGQRQQQQQQNQPGWLDALEGSLGRAGAPIRSIL